jgi:putative DNA primase/helicase
MRRRGTTGEAIEAALLEENRRRCDPPLPDREVREIAASIARYPEGTRSENGPDSYDWPDPIPFPRTAVDNIPVDCLPDWLGDMARAVSESTETPFELSALMSLAVASASVAGKGKIALHGDWTEPLNLYMCPSMESGNRKTAVFDRLVKPFIEWEQQARERVEPI